MEEDRRGDLLGARQKDAEQAEARKEFELESRFMRPGVENEVAFQKAIAFRQSPSGHHTEDSAKYC